MMASGRRDFFKQIFAAGAALTATGMGVATPKKAEASVAAKIKGVCLFVPSLGRASEFVELMNNNAPGSWTVHPLTGSLTERYFKARDYYQEARSSANTFVGAVDPATFALIHAAIIDSGGKFHYITYEDRNRVTFSVQL